MIDERVGTSVKPESQPTRDIERFVRLEKWTMAKRTVDPQKSAI